MAILSIIYHPESLTYQIEFDGDDPLQIITHGCAGEANSNQRHVVLGIIEDLNHSQQSENTIALFIGDMSYTDKVAFTPEMLTASKRSKAESFFNRFYSHPHKDLNIPVFLGVGNHDATGYFNRLTQKGTHNYNIAIESTKAFCEFITSGYPLNETIRIGGRQAPKWHQPNAYYGLCFIKIDSHGKKQRILSIPVIDTNHIDRQPEQLSWLSSFLEEAKGSLVAIAGHHPLTISSDRRVLKKDERKAYGFTTDQIIAENKPGLAYNTSARISRALNQYSSIDFAHLYIYAHHHYVEFIDPGVNQPKFIGSGAAAITLGAAEKMFNKIASKPVCPGFPPGLMFNALGQLATCFLQIPTCPIAVKISYRKYSITPHHFRKDTVQTEPLAQYSYTYHSDINRLTPDALGTFKIAPYFFSELNNGDKLAFIRNMLMLARLGEWPLLKACILCYIPEFTRKDHGLSSTDKNKLIEFIKTKLPNSITINSKSSPSVDELTLFIDQLRFYLLNIFFYEGVAFNHLIRFAGAIEFCFRLMLRMLSENDYSEYLENIPELTEQMKKYDVYSILNPEQQSALKQSLFAVFNILIQENSIERKHFLLICQHFLSKQIAPEQILKTIIESAEDLGRNTLGYLIHHQESELKEIFSISNKEIETEIEGSHLSPQESIANIIVNRIKNIYSLNFIYKYAENLIEASPTP